MTRSGAKRSKTGVIGRSLPRGPGAMPRQMRKAQEMAVKDAERAQTGKSLAAVLKR